MEDGIMVIRLSLDDLHQVAHRGVEFAAADLTGRGGGEESVVEVDDLFKASIPSVGLGAADGLPEGDPALDVLRSALFFHPL